MTIDEKIEDIRSQIRFTLENFGSNCTFGDSCGNMYGKNYNSLKIELKTLLDIKKYE